MIIRLGLLVLLLLYQIQLLHASQKTNINQVSDFFNQNINNQSLLEQEINNSKHTAEQAIVDKTVLPILQTNESALEAIAYKLDAIPANQLENAGQIENAKEENKFLHNLQVDYSEPLMERHKSDMDKIANASFQLMSQLSKGLKQYDIDCQQIVGNQQYETNTHIEIEQIPTEEESVYTKQICEELRNKYSCYDILTVQCARVGIRYTNWQDRVQEFTGSYLYLSHNDWMYAIKWKASRFGIYLSTDYNTTQKIRLHIANQLGVEIEQVDYVTYSTSGVGDVGYGYPYEVGPKAYTWAKFIINYKYRDKFSICELWQESWQEVCQLQ